MASEKRDEKHGHDEFVLNLVGCQEQLYAYILSLVLRRDNARDLLQQTNVVLLEKESEFEPGSNFAAWACRVAFYEVLGYRRKMGREKHFFSEQLLSLIAEDAEMVSAELGDRMDALKECLNSLNETQRKLVQSRYQAGGSVKELAKIAQKTPNAISAELHRIRNALAECIRHRLERAAAR